MIYVKMGLTFSQLPGAMEPACADRVPAWSWLLVHVGSLFIIILKAARLRTCGWIKAVIVFKHLILIKYGGWRVRGGPRREAEGARARAARRGAGSTRAGLAVQFKAAFFRAAKKGVQIEMASGLRKVFYETPIVYNYNVAHRIRTRLTTWSLAHAARTHCETWSASVKPGGQLTNRSWRPIAAGGGRPAPWPPFWAAEPRM